MRITASEYLKLFLNKIFVICLVAGLLLNVFFLTAMQYSDSENSALISNIEAYDQLLEDCQNSTDKSAFIKSKTIETQIAFLLCREDLSPESGVFDEYKAKYPNEYNSALVLDMTRDELENRMIMILNISSQISYIDGYDEFISNMKTRAEEQSNFSIFAKEDSFSYKNIAKTPIDFEAVNDIEPEIGNNKMYEVSTQFELTDYIMLLLVLIICIVLVSVEREKGLYSLIRATKKGRIQTAMSKLFVIITVVVSCCILFYVSDVLVCGAMFGFDDLSRNIQSSSIFMNCSLDVSISTYLIIWVLAKTLLMCSIAIFVSFLFAIINSPAKTYILLAFIFVFEFATYMFINGNSVFGTIKYINIFYLLSNNNAFGYYLNVNFFNQPINIINVFEVIVVLLIAVGFIGFCIAFTKLTFTYGKFALFEKIRAKSVKRVKIKGSLSIYKGEAYKHYKTSFAIFAVFLLAFIGWFNLTDNLTILFSSSDESAYNEYMQTLEGFLDEEKYEFINSEKEYFNDLLEKKVNITNDSTLSEDEKTSQLSLIQTILDVKGKAFDDICAQVAYAEEKAQSFNESPALVNEIVNKRLVQDTFREWEYFTLLIAIVIFSTSNILACEYKKSMVGLISTNKFGRGRLLTVKLFTVLVTTIISFVMIYLPYMINFINTFGTKSFDLPLAYVRDFSMLTNDLTVAQYICILGVLHLAVALASTALVYMLSYLLKNQLVTMIVSSGLLLIPCILFINNSKVRMVNAFLNGSQNSVIITVFVLCVFVAIFSVVLTFIKYNHMNWRFKNARS